MKIKKCVCLAINFISTTLNMRTQGMKYHTLPLNKPLMKRTNNFNKKSHYINFLISYTSKRHFSISNKTINKLLINNINSNRKILDSDPFDDKFKE